MREWLVVVREHVDRERVGCQRRCVDRGRRMVYLVANDLCAEPTSSKPNDWNGDALVVVQVGLSDSSLVR